jgi:phosphatidylglycerophosphatase C
LPDLAAFDFDGTLTDGGSVFDFLSALTGRGAVLAATARLAPRLAHAALVGGPAADQTKELLFRQLLAGITVERFEEVAASFARQHVARHLRVPVKRRLDWHLGRGDQVVIVSASPEAYVGVAGAILGASGSVGTRLAVDGDGLLTGRYDGANCRGTEKLRRLRQWTDDHGAQPARVWAYGNSRGDLRMLDAADVGVNVGRLGPLGALRSFPDLSRSSEDTRPD